MALHILQEQEQGLMHLEGHMGASASLGRVVYQIICTTMEDATLEFIVWLKL